MRTPRMTRVRTRGPRRRNENCGTESLVGPPPVRPDPPGPPPGPPEPASSPDPPNQLLPLIASPDLAVAAQELPDPCILKPTQPPRVCRQALAMRERGALV